MQSRWQNLRNFSARGAPKFFGILASIFARVGLKIYVLLMRTGGVTNIMLCADHFYNKIIACFCAILRIYAPSLEGSKDAFRHELIVFQTSKLAEKAPIQRASCLGSRQDSDCTKNSHFQKMHEPLAGFCRPSFGKFPLKECASFQSIPFRIIQGKSWAPTLYCNSNAQKSWGR